LNFSKFFWSYYLFGHAFALKQLYFACIFSLEGG